MTWSSNKAIHLCWKISFKSGCKWECKIKVLGDLSLLRDRLKCGHTWLGTLLCRSTLRFNSDGFSQEQWKVLCWGHIFKLGKSSQHNWSRRNRELKYLSILFLKSLWVMLQLIFDAENLIIKYVSSRLSCEQLLSGSSLITKKTKGKSVSNSKILDELRASNHWIGVQLWSTSLVRIRCINLQTYPLMGGNSFYTIYLFSFTIADNWTGQKAGKRRKKKKEKKKKRKETPGTPDYLQPLLSLDINFPRKKYILSARFIT